MAVRRQAGIESPVTSRVAPTVSDDAALVQRACAGERWAEDAIYRRHAAYVTRLCSRLLGNRSDADDVVQDTFLVAFEKLASLRDGNALRAWLTQIAVHRARRKLRLRKLFAMCGLAHQDEQTGLLAQAHDDVRPDLRLELAALDRALARESSELRMVWLLHRVQGLSLQETADASAHSLATVKRYIAAVDARIARAHGGPDARGS
jgi:RNA polymerase sigma-70 factor (ECF subfamily)